MSRSRLLDAEPECCGKPHSAEQPERVIVEHLRVRHADKFLPDILPAAEEVDESAERACLQKTAQINGHGIYRKIPPREVGGKVRSLEVREVELDRPFRL